MKSALNRAKTSQIPIHPLIKLCQTTIGPNVPDPVEILHNSPAGPYIPSQQDPAPTDLQQVYKTLIYQQQEQKKAHDSRKDANVNQFIWLNSQLIQKGCLHGRVMGEYSLWDAL